MARYPVGSLPLALPKDRLTASLAPDPVAGLSVASFQKDTLREHPSVQRRSRVLDTAAHYSFTTPFPVPFPYSIPPPTNIEDRESISRGIENWLQEKEPLVEQPLAPTADAKGKSFAPDLSLRKYAATKNDFVKTRHLLGLSQSCLKDLLPALDVGDAFTLLGDPSLEPLETTSTPDEHTPTQATEASHELLDVLSGHSVLMTPLPDSKGYSPNEPAYAPWSLRYSGHQFGVWAGPLGDGRAVSILETPHPDDPEKIHEIQLKGSGRTPFSRNADGLAVLRSSIREFLGSEAVNALGIPTTRALSLISLPEISVVRERRETSAIISRVSPSFIRVGNFEAFNPPQSSGEVVYLFGGSSASTSQRNWESLRILGEWVVRRVLKLGKKEGEPWGRDLVTEAARRNAKMVAGWQAYGWMHGVINTDNVAVSGLTIDYGPYAFMDIYEYAHICNSEDDMGRYSFKMQPTMIIYAAQMLLRSLAPLIGAEEESGKAVEEGWADNVPKEKIDQWHDKGLAHAVSIEVEIQEIRLGLRNTEDFKAKRTLLTSLLNLLEENLVDFHSSFRKLSFFRPSLLDESNSGALSMFIDTLDEFVPSFRKAEVPDAWKKWLESYAEHINREDPRAWKGKGGQDWLDVREALMKSVNPRFVLRQWVLEDVIKVCQDGDLRRSRAVLGKILRMATEPFRPWGGEGREEADLSAEELQERRVCSIGEQKMRGFQCSCSS
ncbi:uncharacterized protein EI90DRAFT_3143793 [Cantharellus anzutake]|uniref:uncharacterized protein n=1 Tax=Cantharellus anzutake TaxID=1750568 RepID=UPI001906424B|nr:uncharacterized protein EI90DRAFT_3143793 [Cantharellus anzutake]KAF8340263.1 hypothetical protein EI90DRAFT_3143793 [Cantharellus anzutake]